MRKLGILLVLAVAASCGGDAAPKKQDSNNGGGNNGVNNGTTANNGTANNGANNGTVNNDLDPTADDDNDGVLNGEDNCPLDTNSSQTDQDADGRGDVCDNCVDTANRDQADEDGNGVGDACPGDHYYQQDLDSDRDGTIDVLDNCRTDANPAQTDGDGDGVGDFCDNCIDAYNPYQTDSDADGIGDSCSPSPAGPLCGTTQPMGISPDLWILHDNSGSISQYPAPLADGIVNFVAANESDTRFGFSGQTSLSSCLDTLYQPLGETTATQVQSLLATVEYSGGSTPNVGLARVNSERYLFDATDPNTAARQKAVVLISDNPGNTCTENGIASEVAADLLAQGITVHVIGYEWIDPQAWLTEVSQSGGGQMHLASSVTEVTNALQQIRDSLPGGVCKLAFDAIPDPTKVWLTVNGAPIARDTTNGYSVENNVISLNGAACDAAEQGQVEVTFGCLTMCVPTAEACNYEDDNCDGIADEGCSTCEPEKCNGSDDDCDGEIDEGC